MSSGAVQVKSEKNNGLLEAAAKMRDSLTVLKEINSKANVIALNAAIEGARTRGRLDSFSIVAEQIAGQASRNSELSEQLDQLVSKLQKVALRSTATRYYELAEDLIDKVDRNLFERNCDVQAWVQFDAIVACAKAFRHSLSEELSGKDKTDETIQKASKILDRLVATYCVYSDVFLCNQRGIVIAAAKRSNLIGQGFAETEWFKTAIGGQVHVADMQFDPCLGHSAVFYTAPVVDEGGVVIGVLTTRFDWAFGQEMIDHANYDSDVQAYFINRQGIVIGATDSVGIMSDQLHWLDAGRLAMKGGCGYTIETARNGSPLAVGFARTKGYNAYKGKDWSAVVTSRLGNIRIEHIAQVVKTRDPAASLGLVQSPLQGPAVDPQTGMRAKIESEQANDELQATMKQINDLVSLINMTNNETNMLAINAAIQAGIAGTEGESFAVIAAEISRLAEKSVQFVESVNKTARELQAAVEETVAARLSDAARDTIDKVDRNLFERFCDVQAWTGFDNIVSATLNGDLGGEVSDFLAKIHKIYEVYHDIYLLDAKGTIVATGVRRDLRGQNQSNRVWFQNAVQGKVHVSEVYHSSSAGGLAMAFSAPVIGPDGTVTGVLTTRFDWKFIYGILDAVIADSKSKVYLLNAQGVVLGSSDRQGILEKSFAHLGVFREIANFSAGHGVEKDRDDAQTYSIGFSRTTGYNSYVGKGWSTIIRRKVEPVSTDAAETVNSENPVISANTETGEIKRVA